jgi:hypothetical protein
MRRSRRRPRARSAVRGRGPVAIAAALALALAALPAAAEAAPSWTKVSDFDDPVHVAAPAGDASRLFVVSAPGASGSSPEAGPRRSSI